MKRLYAFFAATLFTASMFMSQQASAQSPDKMSYQAVIRNSSDQLVSNQSVGMQISILQGSQNGTAVYKETQNPTSNANGLVTLEIGTGTSSDDFSAIDWANGPYFIKIETDPSGGTNYTITGTSQLMSVPYALHSNTADIVVGDISSSETDPVFGTSIAYGITDADTSNWNNHTIDTDTQLDSIGIAALGYVAGDHTIDTDTQLDSTGIAALGYVAGAHTNATDIENMGWAIGTDIQAYDDDLTDLADGSLSGSKVGTGIDGTNISTGTVADNRLETTIDRTIFNASDYITALGGVHVGGTTDPGTDNLVVEGRIGIGKFPNYKFDLSDASGRAFNIYNSHTGSNYASYFHSEETGTATGWALGVYATANNSGGSGISYALYGYAQGNSTGVKYGVYGATSGSGTRYGIYCSGNGAYTGTWTDVSDLKFKKDIVRLDNVLDKVLQLQPSTYLYKTSEYDYMGFDDKRDLGLIAQETELIFPEVVSDNHHPGPANKDGEHLTKGIDYKGIDYTKFTPILIRAIQEQHEIVSTQSEEITALKEALTKQKAVSDQLRSDNSALNTKVNDLANSFQKIEQMLNIKASNK